MLYRENPKNGDKLSQLGFGCMRFPKKGNSIDISRSADLVYSSIEKGVNYFDTAYIYPGSEEALGQIFTSEWRSKAKLATKLPVFMCRSEKDINKFFDRQLERLGTDYIDYYLMHMLTDIDSFQKLQSFGIEEWIQTQKKRGRIRNAGFSFHGGRESFKKIVDAYPWDFCMIQYNYLDENNQAGITGLHYAAAKKMPIMIMEPLRGGKLATGLPTEATSIFKEANPNRSAVEWALRWVWNHPEVTLLLSGMGSQDQVDENIRIASDATAGSLTATELETFSKVSSLLGKATKVPCTGCGYCLPCPAGVDIPTCFTYYNETSFEKKSTAIAKYLQSTSFISGTPTFASMCKRCGKCEKHCPQNIKIMDSLADTARTLEPFWVRPASKIVRQFTKGKRRRAKK